MPFILLFPSQDERATVACLEESFIRRQKIFLKKAEGSIITRWRFLGFRICKQFVSILIPEVNLNPLLVLHADNEVEDFRSLECLVQLI